MFLSWTTITESYTSLIYGKCYKVYFVYKDFITINVATRLYKSLRQIQNADLLM